ncbi:MAG: glycosyltransferase family 2 protein [Deltaproteobacteria bacterium]|nr:glycosyltransferase family 2 protein [Deltaproteobacteria bacterium]
MDISVVIVSWNAKRFLLECLQSLYSEHEMEVIVVDNASIDGSPQAVKELFPQAILILNGANAGFAGANNAGIRHSAGRYLCLINSDVTVFRDTLDKMVKYMDEHPSIGILGPMVLNPDLTLQRSCRRFPALSSSFLLALGLGSVFKGLGFFPHDGVRAVEAISGCFMMVRRKAVNEVGPMDERFFLYAEDKDWCRRFRDAGWTNVYYPLARALHYGGSSSKNAPVRFYIEMHRANLQYWRKHRGAISLAAFRAVMMLHQFVRVLRGALLYIIMPSQREEAAHKVTRSLACLKWLVFGGSA